MKLFVSYAFTLENGRGGNFGSCELTVDREPSSMADINKIADIVWQDIETQHPLKLLGQPTILFWRAFP